MVFDPGAKRLSGKRPSGKRIASPALWCAAAALTALLGFAGAARAQDDIDNETPIVAAPTPDAPAPVKKHHRKRRPLPDDADSAAMDPADIPPPPLPGPPPMPSAAPVAAVAPPPSPAAVGLPPGPASGATAAQPAPPVIVPTPAAATPPAGTAMQGLDSQPWSAAVLLDRLCADKLRHNEEDRLYGLISFTVRATLSYGRLKFTAGEIDDTVQDGLDALIKDCPRIEATDRAHRLGLIIDTIQSLALRRMEARKRPMSRADRLAAGEGDAISPEERRLARRAQKPLGKPTAADLSQELTSAEIDAWLDGLPPMQRALALFQYASDVTPQEEEAALGVAPMVLRKDSTAAKTNLMSYFHEEEPGAPNIAASPPIQYREAGTQVAKLLEVNATAAGAPNPAGLNPNGSPGPTLQITGISADLYAGWSLLATATGLPPDKGLDIVAPVMLAVGDGDKRRRVLVVAADEITRPDAPIRRYLLKAYAIDGDGQGVGFHDTLHLVAGGIGNPEAEKTLRTPDLANIEVARCLWHDYGTGPDPGLCR
jgi:DNA-directed RNA polymerase specialized sigma24 family protein